MKRRTVLAFALATGISAGCGSDVPDQRAATSAPQVAQHDDALYVDDDEIWETDGKHRRTLSVCWENWDAHHPEVHAQIRQAVARSWSFVADVAFVGWKSCKEHDADIEIEVGDNLQPEVYGGVGDDMNGMQLNFKGDAGYCSRWDTPAIYQACMEFVGIHEFGHALGFAHEQNRNDKPASVECNEPKQGPNGDVRVGPWDLASIMNYCNPAYSLVPVLSTTDIQGVQRYYGIGRRYVAATLNTI